MPSKQMGRELYSIRSYIVCKENENTFEELRVRLKWMLNSANKSKTFGTCWNLFDKYFLKAKRKDHPTVERQTKEKNRYRWKRPSYRVHSKQ